MGRNLMGLKVLYMTMPPEVKPEQLHVLTIVDFTKLGVATTGVINKQCTLLQKVLQRNPGCV